MAHFFHRQKCNSATTSSYVKILKWGFGLCAVSGVRRDLYYFRLCHRFRDCCSVQYPPSVLYICVGYILEVLDNKLFTWQSFPHIQSLRLLQNKESEQDFLKKMPVLLGTGGRQLAGYPSRSESIDRARHQIFRSVLRKWILFTEKVSEDCQLLRV